MPMTRLDIRELDRPESDLTRQALAIYEAAFPVEEREDIPDLAEAIRRQAVAPVSADYVHHFWAAVQRDTVCGFARFTYFADTRLAFMAYMAIRAEARGQGLGSQLFRRVVDQVTRDAIAMGGPPALGLCWEVERPRDAATSGERNLRERRIRFYLRLGAQLIGQVDFQAPPLRPGLPAIPYHLMFQASSPATALTRPLLVAVIETVLGHGYGLEHSAPFIQRALASLQDPRT
jgi:GNAT superfamily N-acetyltransferase